MKIKLMVLLLILAVSLMLFQCSPEQSETNVLFPDMSLEKTTFSTYEAQLESFAAGIAYALRADDVQDHLRMRVSQINTREKIQDLSEWMNEVVTHQTIAERLIQQSQLAKDQHHQTFNSVNDIFQTIANFPIPLDIYFPVAEHRDNWYANRSKLLIASPPLQTNDQFTKPIIAYNLAGKKVLLDPETPPQEPVLIIAPCEHKGKDGHFPPPTLPECGDCDDDDDGGGGGPTGPKWRIFITDFTLMDDHEPWSSGGPEINLRVRHLLDEDQDEETDWDEDEKNFFPDNLQEKAYKENSTYWLQKNAYTINENDYDIDVDTRIEVWEDDAWPNKDDKVEQRWNIYSAYNADFVHEYSLNKVWYYGTTGDANMRMYIKYFPGSN